MMEHATYQLPIYVCSPDFFNNISRQHKNKRKKLTAEMMLMLKGWSLVKYETKRTCPMIWTGNYLCLRKLFFENDI